MIKTFVSEGDKTFYSIGFLFGSGFGLAAIILLIIAARTIEEPRWKLVTVLLAGYFATYSLEQAFYGFIVFDRSGSYIQWFAFAEIFTNVTMFIASISIIVAVLADWKNKVPRDWLHRASLMSILATLIVMPVLNILFIRFIASENP